jgi:hypothetical protein
LKTDNNREVYDAGMEHRADRTFKDYAIADAKKAFRG